MARRPQPVRARAHHERRRVDGAQRPRASSPSFSGADLARRLAGGPAVRLAGDRGHQDPEHWPLAVDEARYAGDGVAVVVAETRARADGRGRARRGRLRAARGRGRRRGRARRKARRSCTRSSARTSATRGSSPPARSTRLRRGADVIVKERYRQQRLIPNAIEPRGVLVAARARHGRVTLWSATQIPHILRMLARGDRSASPRRSCA